MAFCYKPVTFLLLLAVACLVSGDETVVQASGGPDGLSYVYFISDTPRNWYMAKNDCTSRGLQLASIQSAEENDLLLQALSSRLGSTIWLDGTDFGSRGSWYWASTGKAFEYTNWNAATNEPSGGSEQCAHLRANDRFWNDEGCSGQKKYVCEGFQAIA